MASTTNKATAPAVNPSDGNDQYHIAGSVDFQDQILLEALQQFIIPHVGTAMDRTGMKANLLGPEAMKLITALREFISSVVRSSEQAGGTKVEVSLDENASGQLPFSRVVQDNVEYLPEDWDSKLAEDVDTGDGKVNISSLSDDSESSKLNTGDSEFTDNNPRDESSEAAVPDPTFHDYLLRGLRAHVFNKMPIRLLCFVPQGSQLHISLVDKEAIYRHLVSILEARMTDPKTQAQFIGPADAVLYDEAVSQIIWNYAGYAILSHTWLRVSPGEVTYSDWTTGIFDSDSAGYRKLVNFCNVAWKNYGLTLGWMDTVCINKQNSSELDESIRSMYTWYERSKVCVIYLAETKTISNIHCDPWFTRGWTLQELVAPGRVKFYNQHWECFIQDAFYYDKGSFASEEIKLQIYKATTITDGELNGIGGIVCIPLSRKMQLAASRKVTREEDTAYSLMGIFNVSFATAYGEGAERAFYRLLQEILNSTSKGVLDLFNCAGDSEYSHPVWRTSRILPSSPRSYKHRISHDALRFKRPLAPLVLTHIGLHISVLLMPGIFADDYDEEAQHESFGDYSAAAMISFVDQEYYEDDKTTSFFVLDKRAIQHAAAVFNVQQGDRGIIIPRPCFAKLVYCEEALGRVTSMGVYSIIATEEPLVFDLENRNPDVSDGKDYFEIPADELAIHGMQMISLYL